MVRGLNLEVSSMSPVNVRPATRSDRDAVRSICLRAFPEAENQVVAALADSLLCEATDPGTISLVSETGGRVVGHIAFSPVRADASDDWLGYILAPLGVDPGYHGIRIGSQLVESGMELLSGKTARVALVYGDPKYYGRFGFSTEAAARFIPPYALQYPFGWQARVLHEEGLSDQPVRLSCVRALRDPALW